MKNVIWIATIFLAFAAGYFTHGVTHEVPATPQQAESPRKTDNIDQPQNSNAQLSAAAKTIFAEKEKTFSTSSAQRVATEAPTNLSKTPKQPPSPSANDSNAKPAETNSAKEISDEDIDKILQPPYNTMLKNTHGVIREKYKEFADSTKQDAWDINMQNKLTDALLGNVYSKFINIESVTCKINFCEVRATELKSGVSNLITAEMAMQEWWDIGPSQWTTTRQEAGKGNLYMLLVKK